MSASLSRGLPAWGASLLAGPSTHLCNLCCCVPPPGCCPARQTWRCSGYGPWLWLASLPGGPTLFHNAPLVTGLVKERPWIADHVAAPAAEDSKPGDSRKRPLIYV